jgi:trans-2,3-dihydro-3-hydroxyanthranilate isomerase
MRSTNYQLCDVFTAKRFEGNQLAVFPDAGEISDAEMQVIAREMNLSETTFIVRRDAAIERQDGIEVRIFTVQEELRFAGHPTLGTAATIRRHWPELCVDGVVRLRLKAGLVPVKFNSDGSFGEMTQPAVSFGSLHKAEEVMPLLGLNIEDAADGMPIQTVSTGMHFCIVPLRSVEALGRLCVHPVLSAQYLAHSDAKFFYCIAPTQEELTQEAAPQWRARMQFYNGEDPATGSAAGCAIAYLVRHGHVTSDEPVHLRQGVEIHRSSDLFLRARRDGDSVGEVRVGGSTVLVASGQLFLS